MTWKRSEEHTQMVRKKVGAAHFMVYASSLNAAAVVQLLSCGLRDITHAYRFDSMRSSADHMIRNGIPWPLEFITTYNRKHIFGSRKVLTMQTFSAALAQWRNKFSWREWFHQQGESQNDDYAYLRSKRKTRHCPYPLGETADIFLEHAIGSIHAAGKRAIMRAHREKSAHMEPAFMKLVDATLAAYDLHILPTDKDGGFAVCSHGSLQQGISRLWAKPWYKRVYKTDFMDVMEEYTDAAIAISIQQPSLRKALLSDTWKGLLGIVAKLNVTCKTHKPVGEVGFRPIHSFSSSPLAPGMRWIERVLSDRLSSLPHLLKDADCL